VSEVDHFTAGALDDATHDVDGSIMAIEQACGGNDTNLVIRGVRSAYVHDCRLNQVAANLLAEGHTASNNYREL